MKPEQLRPFAWVAWLGVLTTAINTGLLALPIGAGVESWRDIVLLVHAPATLIPVIAIAVLGFSRAPFAAVLAIISTSLEKALEFTGQALRIFPPEEATAAALVPAVWDQLFFVLWACNSVGATAVGLVMLRLLPRTMGLAAAGFAAAAGLLTAILILGPDYVGFSLPAPGALLFFAIFTLYRCALAITLLEASRGRMLEAS